MLIEKELEQKIYSSISSDFEDVQFVLSRSVSDVGTIKEEKEDSIAVIAIGTSARTHEAFSLPMIDINVSIQVCTRLEQDPTASQHEQIVETLMNNLSLWHFRGNLMEASLSGLNYIAAELRMTGGTGRQLDKVNQIWSENITFMIRGTLVFNNQLSID